jgi:L-iditol 2-dehydrogenase
MRTAVLVEPNKIEIQDWPTPKPGPGEVLVRVRAVGICGSDTHYFAGKRDYETQTIYPFVLGHEFAGEVALLGPRVEGVQVGARVYCEPDRPCGACEWCRRGEFNVCSNVRFAGSGRVLGCLSEHYLVAGDRLFPLADQVGFAEATLVEPLAIGLHIVDNLVRPRGGETYAVVGTGPIGLVTIFAARRRGASDIYASDRIPGRLEVARKLGADHTCVVPGEDFVRFIEQHTGGRGVDVAVEAAGDLEAIGQLTRLPRIHGLGIIEGIPPAAEAAIDVNAARRRELTIIAGRRSLLKTAEALGLIETGEFDPGLMITHRFPLTETQKAFEYTRDYSDGVIKAIVEP